MMPATQLHGSTEASRKWIESMGKKYPPSFCSSSLWKKPESTRGLEIHHFCFIFPVSLCFQCFHATVCQENRFRYLFYVDFLASVGDPQLLPKLGLRSGDFLARTKVEDLNVSNALRHLQEMTTFFRVQLGQTKLTKSY